MSKKQLHDFASIPRTGLPKHVKKGASKMDITKLSNADLAYLEGFIKSCADKGVDPEVLLEKMSGIGSAVKAVGKTVGKHVRRAGELLTGSRAKKLEDYAKHRESLGGESSRKAQNVYGPMAVAERAKSFKTRVGTAAGAGLAATAGGAAAVDHMNKKSETGEEQPAERGVDKVKKGVKNVAGGAGKGALAGAGIGAGLGAINGATLTGANIARSPKSMALAQKLKMLITDTAAGAGLGAIGGAGVGAFTGGVVRAAQ
jgi:hypothetical protein